MGFVASRGHASDFATQPILLIVLMEGHANPNFQLRHSPRNGRFAFLPAVLKTTPEPGADRVVLRGPMAHSQAGAGAGPGAASLRIGTRGSRLALWQARE